MSACWFSSNDTCNSVITLPKVKQCSTLLAGVVACNASNTIMELCMPSHG